MITLNETQKTILHEFFKLTCDEDEGFMIEDEFVPLVGYPKLEKETGIRRAILKVEVIEMRDMGLLELFPAVDCDYMPSGSGYGMTSKGHELALSLFLTKKENHDEKDVLGNHGQQASDAAPAV